MDRRVYNMSHNHRTQASPSLAFTVSRLLLGLEIEQTLHESKRLVFSLRTPVGLCQACCQIGRDTGISLRIPLL